MPHQDQTNTALQGEKGKLGNRAFSWRTNLDRISSTSKDAPLIVALHGGLYTSAYFDVPGHSLLDRAAALDIPVIALDRPGYLGSVADAAEDASHAGNAALLNDAIDTLWETFGADRPGIVLIGHSIGGAIALRIAALRPRWPLLGVAVSGIGLINAPQKGEPPKHPPETTTIAVPNEVKDRGMFGLPGTFSPDATEASRVADAPGPIRELMEISKVWPAEAKAVLGQIAVPVHYRQADGDALWIVNDDEIAAFAAACTSAPSVDAGLVAHSGHCIDFHRAGPAFQLDQLAFALRTGFAARFN